MGRSGPREKGKRFELEVARIFKARGYPNAERNVQSKGGDHEGQDIEGVPFAVECKRTKSPIFTKVARDGFDQSAWAEVARSGAKGEPLRPSIVVTRWDGCVQPWVVTTLTDFLNAVEEAYQRGVADSQPKRS
ncbi:MAG: hypothetical protein MJA83_06285 [Gammaproteobacteria bacterium]|nr:hypothetical protein [Gammaproteobacteria bacterium]